MEPLISIIIPVYNTPVDFLRTCLNSIIPAEDNIEIIVVNDGSTDNEVVAVCDEYAKKFKEISTIHIKNSGVSKARNTGIEASQGEYIVFLDSDDCFVDGAIKKITYAINKSNADIVFFDFIKCYATNNETITYSNSFDEKLYLGQECNFILSDALVVEKGLALCWAKAYKKSFLCEKSIRFDTSLVFAEDADFSLRCFSNAKSIFYLSKPLYCYNLSNSSSVRRYNEKMPDYYTDSMEGIINTISSLGNKDLIKAVYNFSLYHLLIIAINNVFHNQSPLKFSQKVKKMDDIKKRPCFSNAFPYVDYSMFSKLRAIALFCVKNRLYFAVSIIAAVRRIKFKG